MTKEERQAYNKYYYQEHKLQHQAYKKAYYLRHRDRIRRQATAYSLTQKQAKATYCKNYYLAHREQLLAQAKQYGVKHRARRAAYHKAYRQKYADRLRAHANQYVKSRLLTDPKFRLTHRFRSAVGNSLRQRGGSKAYHSWHTLVGYTREQLINHLEHQFQPGMNWGNYGAWHIDHIRPVCSFTFTSANDPQFKLCWKLANLRPLWARENIQKGQRDKQFTIRN